MKSFCCFASGENFPLDLNGKVAPMGFFVSVFVNAIDSTEAESMSLKMLLAHPTLTIANGAQVPADATILFKVVHELVHHVEHPKVTEFQFFEMDA